MFDPFGDFEQRGYLRNFGARRDKEEVRIAENQSFLLNFPEAIRNLENTKDITYTDFLKTHQILFGDFYPWAGQDRATVLPNNAVNKGSVIFSHPSSARLAVEYGLSIGQDKERMKKNCGEVMGNFAYGHPFLDGNGRTMFLVHMELCHRAGFSIAWEKTTKKDYLTALTLEIEDPSKGHLDHYLKPFKQPSMERSKWGSLVVSVLDVTASKTTYLDKTKDLFRLEIAKPGEVREKVRHYASNFAKDVEEKIGLKTTVDHSGSRAGPSSYVYVSHPSELVWLKTPFRFSGHSKGAFNHADVVNIHTIEDYEKNLENLKKIKEEFDQRVKVILDSRKEAPTKPYSEKKLKQKEEYERQKLNKDNGFSR